LHDDARGGAAVSSANCQSARFCFAALAADLDREMMGLDHRLGENDTWIAGFCRYYPQLVISRDTAFDRVPGLRRIGY
jgi:predicted nucleic acid-binding protein